ncbi:MAG: alanine--tRNA ligase [Candidatus Bipolaricaulota bacterium]
MTSAELRRRYLGFFAERGHKLLPSSSLVPKDPTLLFTAAGMVQFKDYFWGRLAPGFPRATTCQKCFRTTDIEEVGRTAYHHTFFEMLGNFSFGDYFKQGAIEFAWEFLTRELGIPGDRFAITVYEEDNEAYAIWRDRVGIPAERIVRLGKENNWWGPVGDSGPCGPDSELHYDTGADRSCGPTCRGVACDCNRFAEIWNLVFMQYDAQPTGGFLPLAKKNIDTGMGLERATAILQGAETNYDTDAFSAMTEAIAHRAARPLEGAERSARNTIADHVRGALFLVADGVMPGNERQGYVLRRVLRRAIRASERLALPPGSLGSFVEPVVQTLGATYPEIVAARDAATRILDREEQAFRRTLRDGERRLDKIAADLASEGKSLLSGEVAFELTDTYGFPLEMTEEILAERGIRIDHEGFETALADQRTRSRALAKPSTPASDAAGTGAETEFVGYDTEERRGGSSPLAVEAQLVGTVALPDGEGLLFERTPFYAAAGGQIADQGVVENLSRAGKARVLDVRKGEHGASVHHVAVDQGAFELGDRCRLEVDVARRRRIERNHTATHLLHAALRSVLGSHAQQAGSDVADHEFRFDFSHFAKMTPEEVTRVEDFVNAATLDDRVVSTSLVTLEEARQHGAIGLFEDEYKGRDRVRLVEVEGISRELCGGTHVRRTGEIGLVRILSEEGIASGVRRIRAVTGDRSLAALRDEHARIERLRETLGDDPEAGVQKLRERVTELETTLAAIRAQEVSAQGAALAGRAATLRGVRLVSARSDANPDGIKALADDIESRVRPAVVVLVGATDGRATAVCKVSTGLGQVDAGAIVRAMSKILGGGGGGSRAFAQGGGPKIDGLDEALEEGRRLAESALAGA